MLRNSPFNSFWDSTEIAKRLKIKLVDNFQFLLGFYLEEGERSAWVFYCLSIPFGILRFCEYVSDSPRMCFQFLLGFYRWEGMSETGKIVEAFNSFWDSTYVMLRAKLSTKFPFQFLLGFYWMLKRCFRCSSTFTFNSFWDSTSQTRREKWPQIHTLSIPFGILPTKNPSTRHAMFVTFNSFWDSTKLIQCSRFKGEAPFQFLLGFYALSVRLLRRAWLTFNSFWDSTDEVVPKLTENAVQLSIPFGILRQTRGWRR